MNSIEVKDEVEGKAEDKDLYNKDDNRLQKD